MNRGKREVTKTISSSAGDGKRVQLALRAKAYGTWPLERRVEFFSRTGTSLFELRNRILQKEAVPKHDVDRLMTFAAAVAPEQNETYGTSAKGSAQRFPRPGEKTSAVRACEAATKRLGAMDAVTVEQRRRGTTGHGPSCCERDGFPGANSMTMLRAPFARAVSAYFYRGHSPNYDNYGLRPGLWPGPGKRSHVVKRARSTLKEYFWLDEYRNVLTKMFGDSTSCTQVHRCGRGHNGGACAMVTGCHGYRNASSYLDPTHVDAAVEALAGHAFFGLLEAYNASVLLASYVFGLDDLDPEDFAKSRVSSALDRRCSPPRVLRNDATACREAYRASHLDNVLFERAHRIFCARLDESGLSRRPDIRTELQQNRLCGDVDFSNADHFCGRLETPVAKARFLLLRNRCRGGASWWRTNYGFYWTPDEAT